MPATEHLDLRPIRVGFGENYYYDAYSLGEKWNGFEVPYFTKEQADKLLDSPMGLKFDADKNAYVNETEYEEDDAWGTVEINGETYYAIGGRYWDWLPDPRYPHPFG